MDGWGLRDEAEANAVRIARTPVVDRLWAENPHTTLDPSGEAVGLPAGLMGNSEVGHLNLGAGRVVYQDIQRIYRSIEEGSFFMNEALLRAMEKAKGRTLHLLGLLSDGGVHSHERHLYALLDMAKACGVRDVAVHAFLDGRDTSPTGGEGYLRALQQQMDEKGVGRVATITGRYYAMDRDKRWERVRRAYDALTLGAGKQATDYRKAVTQSYDNGVTDEFVEPIVVTHGDGTPSALIRDGDAVVFFNFRADRARQLTRALTDPSFDDFQRAAQPKTEYVCMTEYDHTFDLPIAFEPVTMKNILGEAAANAGRSTFRIAETEKYAHVTYFFNGGREEPYESEERTMIQSPKVATYDLQPQMSAVSVADALIKALKEQKHDYIVCNFANPDMVGHTGVLAAAIAAVETVDTCVGRVIEALDDDDVAIVTADHGNAEMMVDPVTGEAHTAHTTNPVPCILIDKQFSGELVDRGWLCDIAPTICRYIDVPVPEEMTGKDLRKPVILPGPEAAE